MKKFNFFSEEFLNECETELIRMIELIESQKFTIHPSAMNNEEIQLQKLFANRLLTILYHGKRINHKEWMEGLYVLAHWVGASNSIK